MGTLSGTAVRVDNTPDDTQVDLSPCQHLSLPAQSLIQRQPNRVWAHCVYSAGSQTHTHTHTHTHKHTHTLSLCPSIIHPLIYPLGLCFHRHPGWILTGHLYFCAPLQKGSHPVPHDAAVEASVGAVQRRDEVPLKKHRNTHIRILLHLGLKK